MNDPLPLAYVQLVLHRSMLCSSQAGVPYLFGITHAHSTKRSIDSSRVPLGTVPMPAQTQG